MKREDLELNLARAHGISDAAIEEAGKALEAFDKAQEAAREAKQVKPIAGAKKPAK